MPAANVKTLRAAFLNPLADMLPLKQNQRQVYQFAEIPPGLEGYQPRWEVANAVVAAQGTIQLKVDLMTDFHLLALYASASVATGLGGFRTQFYDVLKQRRLMDRGLQFPLVGGGARGGAFLREPYRFDVPKSQLLIILQNMEVAPNTVQLALYGVAAPFPGTMSNEF